MQIRNVNFEGFVFGQSGVQGFFGESDEYRHHKLFKRIPGFSFRGMVFVAKTITLDPRIYPETSNTELKEDYKVKRFFPSSVWWSLKSFVLGYLLNAVGLANPGAKVILRRYGYKWMRRYDSFHISFMPMKTTLEDKLEECREFGKLLGRFIVAGDMQVALQVNLSCPNTGHGQTQDPTEVIEVLKILRELLPDVPIVPKFDLLVEPKTISEIKPYCDAFMISNSISFGKMQERINWKKLFKGGLSPLGRHFGGKFFGGLSGAPLFPPLVEWLERMEKHDAKVIIIAGGGIMKKKDIQKLSQFRIVHAIALGSVAILRPWRLQGLIRYGNKIFSKRFN